MSDVRTTAATTVRIENGRVVGPESVFEGSVAVEDGVVSAVGPDVDGSAETLIDADGKYVLPGLIDLHGDDIEGHLFPRSNSRMTIPMALASADRANVAAGVTTKFHAISFKDAPDEDRSPELAVELVEGIDAAESTLTDHRIHARCEVSDEAGVEAATAIVDRRAADLVSIMCHVPGKGQFRDVEKFLEWHRQKGEDAYDEAKRRVEEAEQLDDAFVRRNVDRVVAHARAAGLPVASHDDESPEEVTRIHDRGVTISEYPVTMGAAGRAAELGMTTAMGAPNLVKGGSQWGNLGSREAIDAGFVDVLVADYHPPSLLAAPFVETGEPLPERVARVTRNPADAVGLEDRGRIDVGYRADLIVVDPEPTPTVERALVAGRPVYRAGVT
jgi:alpha-D-ribose 1-methylphosphonate 5-triphosphate diphosphatase